MASGIGAVVVVGSGVAGDVVVPETETDPDAGARPRNALITAATLLTRESLGAGMDGGAGAMDEVSTIPTGGTMRRNLGISHQESPFRLTMAISMRHHPTEAGARTRIGCKRERGFGQTLIPEDVSHEGTKMQVIRLQSPGLEAAGTLGAAEEAHTVHLASRASQQIIGGNVLLSQGPQTMQILIIVSTTIEPEGREKSLRVLRCSWIVLGGHRRPAGPYAELSLLMCRTTTRAETGEAGTTPGTDKRRIKVHQESRNKQIPPRMNQMHRCQQRWCQPCPLP